MKFIMTLLSLVLLGSGCSGATEPVGATGVIIPLSVGNKWIGEATDYASGAVFRIRVDTIGVEKDTVIDGERRYLISRQNGYVNRSDGAYAWGLGQGGDPLLQFKYPAQVGDSVVHGDSTLKIVVHVLSTDEFVTVPAGTYSCFHYFITGNVSQFETDYFVAPNIGYVKVVSIAKPGPSTVIDSTSWVLTRVELM